MIKNKVLLFLLVFLLFFNSCITTEYRYYSYYDFGGSDNYTHILLEETEIIISLFETNSEFDYRFSLSLGSVEQPLSQFKNIVINNLAIYIKDNEINMLNKIIEINPYIENSPRGNFWGFEEYEIKNVYSNGIIDIETRKENLNLPSDARTRFILFDFIPIPIDRTKNSQITMYIDITFENVTGEKTRWEHTFKGTLILKTEKITRPFLTI